MPSGTDIIHNYPGGYQAARADGMTKFNDVIPLDSTGRTISAHHPISTEWLLNKLGSRERNDVRVHIASKLGESHRLRPEFVEAVQVTLKNLKIARDRKSAAAHSIHSRGNDDVDTLANQFDHINAGPTRDIRVTHQHDRSPVEHTNDIRPPSSPYRESTHREGGAGGHRAGHRSRTSTHLAPPQLDRRPDDYNTGLRSFSSHQPSHEQRDRNLGTRFDGPPRHTRREPSQPSQTKDELIALELHLQDIKNYVEEHVRDRDELDYHKFRLAAAELHLVRLQRARHVSAEDIDEARKVISIMQPVFERPVVVHRADKPRARHSSTSEICQPPISRREHMNDSGRVLLSPSQMHRQRVPYEESAGDYDRSRQIQLHCYHRRAPRSDHNARSSENHHRSNSRVGVLRQQIVLHEESPRNFDRSWEDEAGGRHRHKHRSNRNSTSNAYEYNYCTNNLRVGIKRRESSSARGNTSMKAVAPFPVMPSFPGVLF